MNKLIEPIRAWLAVRFCLCGCAMAIWAANTIAKTVLNPSDRCAVCDDLTIAATVVTSFIAARFALFAVWLAPKSSVQA
jgi:hypothetical protein